MHLAASLLASFSAEHARKIQTSGAKVRAWKCLKSTFFHRDRSAFRRDLTGHNHEVRLAAGLELVHRVAAVAEVAVAQESGIPVPDTATRLTRRTRRDAEDGADAHEIDANVHLMPPFKKFNGQ
jgi:hypothetical protein